MIDNNKLAYLARLKEENPQEFKRLVELNLAENPALRHLTDAVAFDRTADSDNSSMTAAVTDCDGD